MAKDEQDVQRKCADCGCLSPVVQTGYTLISPAHGWRLTKVERNGVREMQWRCRDCFAKFRDRGAR